VAIVSDTPDIANARIEFDNGCVANLTASRISMKNMRKTRLFQGDAYIAIDFLDKETEIIRLKNLNHMNEAGPLDMVIEPGPGKKPKQIMFERPEIHPVNAIKTELESFYNSIASNSLPPVTIIDGYNALKVAYSIMEKLNLPES
jgi:predicted dehydrogenase